MLLRLNNSVLKFERASELIGKANDFEFPEILNKKFQSISNISALNSSKSGYYLLADILKNEYGKDIESISFEKSGKPYLNNGPFISLSHSHDFVCAVASNLPVGVDIEKIRDFDLKILDRFFTSREKRYVLKRNTNERFFRLWTFKEAVIKLEGKTLADIKSIEPIIIGNRIFYKNYKTISKTHENYVITMCFNEKTGK